MLYDFHTHTFLSDGELSPVELARRALVRGYTALVISDHVGPGNCEWVLAQLRRDCELVRAHWNLIALPGVEITHVPPQAIPAVARLAREAGAALVIVHGETIVEPVEPGTNLAAVCCPDVDVLGHPGLLTAEEARLAAEHGVSLELTSRRGHSLTNGLVYQRATAAGAKLIVDSDSHAPGDLLTPELARDVALGAGVPESDLDAILLRNPAELIARAQPRG